MTSEKKVWPLGTNHTDSEGTPWKRDEQNNWWFWQENFGWSRYVGPVKNPLMLLVHEIVLKLHKTF
ncbi:hypothetical protein GY132_00285 [Acinetobacter baumannii]|uniref:hypothetical protein n=1 Tax=Acinetobacter baumannii TaxID=470 RepID=UPI00138F7265|nr:hypothetical protein [Acinetobacter baumannii]NDO07371.1 hypothetical protein [Acinetobacter baumannii]HBM1231532.1 hypothetical protein [Acinetobacter baumannii]